MDDLISRQTAIDAMCKLMKSWFGGDTKDEQEEIKWIINHLPPAQLEQQWIPTSERLPEPEDGYMEDEYVLISKKPSKISGSKWSVTIAIRTADPRSGKIQWRDSGFGVIQDDEVLAWMPRPKPYQEGNQDAGVSK